MQNGFILLLNSRRPWLVHKDCPQSLNTLPEPFTQQSQLLEFVVDLMLYLIACRILETRDHWCAFLRGTFSSHPTVKWRLFQFPTEKPQHQIPHCQVKMGWYIQDRHHHFLISQMFKMTEGGFSMYLKKIVIRIPQQKPSYVWWMIALQNCRACKSTGVLS